MKNTFVAVSLSLFTLFGCSSNNEPITEQINKINTDNTTQAQTTRNTKVVVAKHKITESQSN